MTPAPRAAAAVPASLLLLLRGAARPAAAQAPRCLRVTAPVTPARRTAASPWQAAEARAAGSYAARRWYSAGGGESQVPGSRIWTFDEVKQQVEAADGRAAQDPSRKEVVIVDVREPGELQSTGKIPGAVNIPITSAVQSFHVDDADFEDMYGFARPPRDATLLFYCKAGVRARSAAALAAHAGWASVGEYPGSWIDWEKHGGPVEKVSGSQGGPK